jgi:hypothetical protein
MNKGSIGNILLCKCHMSGGDVDPCHLTVTGIEQMLREIEKRSKITGVRVSPHTFRHTFARMFLENGGDVYKLSLLLGHSSVWVTIILLIQHLFLLFSNCFPPIEIASLFPVLHLPLISHERGKAEPDVPRNSRFCNSSMFPEHPLVVDKSIP